jgi:hypothetical protein
MASATQERVPTPLPRSEPFPKRAELFSADSTRGLAVEFAEMLAMSLEGYEGDLDAATAWHLHTFADGLRLDAGRLLEHASEIEQTITSLYEDRGLELYR